MESGFIHVHSEYSRYDSTATVDSILEKAFQLKSAGVVLTDHGTMMGGFDLQQGVKKYAQCCVSCDGCPSLETCSRKEAAKDYQENGIVFKAIQGIEGYLFDTDEYQEFERAHFVLIPKNNIGLEALYEAVSETSKNMVGDVPAFTFEILKKYFGYGSSGYGNVFCSSACMGGIICSIFMTNSKVEHKIEALRKKIDALPSVDDITRNNANELTAKIEAMSALIKEAKKIASAPFKKRENAVERLRKTDAEAANEAEKILLADKRKSAKMAEAIPVLIRTKTILEETLRPVKAYIDKNSKEDKRDEYLEKIAELEKQIKKVPQLRTIASREVKKFSEIFGKDNFFLEVQNHGIPEEAILFPEIVRLSVLHGNPLLATTDAHMVSNSPEELKKRQIIRSLRFNKYEEPRVGDSELYMKTDEELREALAKIIPANYADVAIRNITRIFNSCNVSADTSEHYPVFDCKGISPAECLREKAQEGISWRYPDEWCEEYQKRLDYELSVIDTMGFSSYLLIVEDFLKYGRLLGKIDTSSPEFLENPYDMEYLEKLAKGNYGVGVGPGRGSAVGSIVCYLIGITGVDPMKHNLLFERFLNPERVSMPDIDSDFRPDIRGLVVEYVKHKYGEQAVCCISTKGTLQCKSAIRSAARIISDKMYGKPAELLPLVTSICDIIPSAPDTTFADCLDDIKTAFATDPIAMKIINDAVLIEGCFINIGVHAAGVVIADNGNISKYIPLMYVSGKGEIASQYDKDAVESLGLLKMDFLGLKNLSFLTKTIEMIGKPIDLDEINFEDKDVFKNIFSTGKTNSVFQFESDGMKQMLRQFKPETIEDIILLVAAYRPGPMQYLADIIAVKNGEKEPSYVIPEMEEILGATYGSPIYQEQIMAIFNRFAGFSLGESDIIRRYMSKKKTEKFMAYKDKFIEGFCSRGASAKDAETFWAELVEFSKYAFNKSHAAAYAYIAYYTAYLKYYYSVEYSCATLSLIDGDKKDKLIAECRADGIVITPPDINNAESEFTAKFGKVIYGFSSIKNIGIEVSQAIVNERNTRAFCSLADFMVRCNPSKDVVESLIFAGAFDEMCSNRKAVYTAGTIILEKQKKIKTREKSIEIRPHREEIYRSEINSLLEDILMVSFDEEKDFPDKLAKEKDLLGAYISANPIDDYVVGKTDYEINNGQSAKISGIITNLRIANRKSDGKKMAFFTLESRTDTIAVCVFTQAYSDYGENIVDDAVVDVFGTGKLNDDEIELFATEVKPCKRKAIAVVAGASDALPETTVVENSNPVLCRIFENRMINTGKRIV